MGGARPTPARDRAARMIRLLVADAHQAFVEALSVRLDAEPGLRVVAAVARPEQVLHTVRTRPVDVAALTVDGAHDFLGLARPCLDARPRLRLVAVAECNDVPRAARAVRAGFLAWVPKDAGVAEFVDVLEGVCRGEARIPPLLLAGLLPYLVQAESARRAADDLLSPLTAREAEVLKEMCRGATRPEIAERLSISPNTVRTHMQSILAKLDVHSSLAAVTLARRAGIC